MKGKHMMMAGVALACATTAALAANPTDKARVQAQAAAIARNPDAAIGKQPKTMAQADATLFRTKSGGAAVRVPTELWSTIGVRRDAEGNVQLTEHEGEAPATTTEGLPNE
jgi:hypothetical protein